MAIYLVRHGKDEEGYRGGWSDRGLVDEGVRESEKLAQYLSEHNQLYNIQEIRSSDLRRALMTAEVVAQKLGLPVIRSEKWRETNNGVLAGMPNETASEKYPGLYFSSLRMDERYPGGESPIENYMRIEEVFNELCGEHIDHNHNKNILVVTHGGVINIVYHILKNIRWTNKNKFFPASNTGIHRIERVNGKWELTLENQTAHL